MRTVSCAARFVVLALILPAAPARAIELSLEENRAERGSVGFIDMQRLFSASPDSARAKESFEELVRQAEERLNLKKAEAAKSRLDLETLKVERETLARSTPTAAAAPEPAKISSRTLALPGMTPLEASPTSPPTASTAAPAAPMTGAAILQNQRLLELDGRIIGLQADLDHKEAEIKRERQEADKGLIDVEGRKTDQVLARLYRAISEVARKEGVSVVVEKTAILYGHPAVDLTDKVLKHLRGNAQP